MSEYDNTIQMRFSSSDDTIPAMCIQQVRTSKKPDFSEHSKVADYELISLMSLTNMSELWYANSYDGDACVVKITKKTISSEIIERVRMLECDNLAELIDCGYEGEYWYEVYPFYREGALVGPIEESVIKTIILPGLINALECLHREGLVHNDIKPENIFWDNGCQKVLLGDFGCVGENKEKAIGFTPAYAAPEVLLKDVSGKYSDWFSVGMTLAKIIDGRALMEAESLENALLAWERGIRFSKGSNLFRQLVNGLIQEDPRKRLGPKAARKFCDEKQFGGEERISTHTKSKVSDVTIDFEKPKFTAVDIDGLLIGIENNWEYSLFLMSQGKFERFLLRDNREIAMKCREYRKMANVEEALFCLTLELTGDNSFIWRGKRYAQLLDMETCWTEGTGPNKDVITFLQCGMLVHYLQRTGASDEQIRFAKRLQKNSSVHPEETCDQLFQALHGDDGFTWKDRRFTGLDDLVDWLSLHIATLDSEIDKMFCDRRFAAWFAYLGMGDALDEIRRKCKDE